MGCSQIEVHARRRKLLSLDCRRKSSVISDAILQNITLTPFTFSPFHPLHQSLIKNPLFHNLTAEQVAEIAKQVLCGSTKQDQYVFKEGDPASCFFIIYSGTVVIQKNSFLKQLSTADCFGELALIYKSNRTASIKCLTDCIFIVIKPMLFKSILRKMKLKQYQENLLTIEAVPFFQSLTNKQKFYVSNIVKTLRFNPSQTIFNMNQKAYSLYILREGKIKILLQDNKEIIIQKFQTFGESAIKEDNLRKGKAIALTNVVCCMISKIQIQRCLGLSINSLIDFHTKRWALLKSPYFKHLTTLQIDTMNIAFKNASVSNDIIPPDQGVIICFEGTLNGLSTESIFNDKEWANGQQPSEVKGTARYGYLPWSKLNEIFDHAPPMSVSSNIDLKTFHFIKVLGTGSFGEVSVIRDINLLNSLHAVKCLNKASILEEDMTKAVIQQKKILQQVIFPYIVGFVKALHDNKHIYLLMEYIQGKQLFTVMRELQDINKNIVQYYFGCVLLSIQYLHSNLIVYRDLKPQNIVISTSGKPFLIDLGAAKLLERKHCFKTFTIVGTPHYMAPQVFSGEGYSFEVDLWSLGCILFQLIYGQLPFGEDMLDADPFDIYNAVCNGKVNFGKKVKDCWAEHLILSLLRKNPNQRRLTASVERIKNSKYFSNFDWKKLKEEKFIPPYQPTAEIIKNNGKQISYLQYKYGQNDKFHITEWDQTFNQSTTNQCLQSL